MPSKLEAYLAARHQDPGDYTTPLKTAAGEIRGVLRQLEIHADRVKDAQWDEADDELRSQAERAFQVLEGSCHKLRGVLESLTRVIESGVGQLPAAEQELREVLAAKGRPPS